MPKHSTLGSVCAKAFDVVIAASSNEPVISLIIDFIIIYFLSYVVRFLELSNIQMLTSVADRMRLGCG